MKSLRCSTYTDCDALLGKDEVPSSNLGSSSKAPEAVRFRELLLYQLFEFSGNFAEGHVEHIEKEKPL